MGTPGRVIDFVESGKLPLDKVSDKTSLGCPSSHRMPRLAPTAGDGHIAVTSTAGLLMRQTGCFTVSVAASCACFYPTPACRLVELKSPQLTLSSSHFSPSFPQIRFFVLDEADRLLDSEDVIMKLFRRLPKGGAGLARLQVGLAVCQQR